MAFARGAFAPPGGMCQIPSAVQARSEMGKYVAVAIGMAGLAVLAVAAGALAQSETRVRIDYERGPGARGCPQETALRDAVAARLGYDPFEEDASGVLRARIRRTEGAFRAKIQLLGEGGAVQGARKLNSTARRCEELADPLVVAMSTAIDPLAVGRPAGEPGAGVGIRDAGPRNEPGSASPKPAEPPPARRRSEPERHSQSQAASRPRTRPRDPSEPADSASGDVSTEVRAGLGVLTAIKTLPDPTAAFSAWGNLRWGPFSVELEGRADLPASDKVGEMGRVHASLLQASVLPCGHYEFLFGCGVVSLGALRAEGQGLEQSSEVTSFFAATGGRLGAQYHFGESLLLRIRGQLVAVLARTTLLVDRTVFWRSPVLAGSVGMDLGVRFQ